jgi:ABC-type transport system substrate-binding protein
VIAGDWRQSASAALEIADDLARAGVTARIRSYAEATFWGAKDAGGILAGGRYDLALTSWSPGLDPDRSYLFGCEAQPPGGGNSMGWCNRAYDREEAAGAAVYETAAPAAHYRAAGALLALEVPVIPLGLERSVYAVSPRLRGFRPNPLGRDFWNAWEWTVEPAAHAKRNDMRISWGGGPPCDPLSCAGWCGADGGCAAGYLCRVGCEGAA